MANRPLRLTDDSHSMPALAGRTDVVPQGGPRTEAGKAVSRGNALTHGLSAKRLLPSVLATGLIDPFEQQLRDEWNPETPTQKLHVREMARHQAALDRVEKMEEAVLRQGARTPLALGLDFGSGDVLEDAMFASAGTSDGLQLLSRYRRQHERALARSLAILRDLKVLTMSISATAPAATASFITEQQCEVYLFERMRQTEFCCERCRHDSASWLAARHVWQCDKCRRQTSLRTGTVMENSRVSLLAWFRTIEAVLMTPDASLSAIAAASKLERAGTLRKMVHRIREALAAPDASQRLAGLDHYFRRGHWSGPKSS